MADYTAYELGNILRRLEKKVDAALCCCESLELKNLGLGVPIYVGRFKNHLKIRSLVAGTNMNITYDNNTITFDSLAGGFTCSDLNSCSTSNLPEGSNLYYTNARVLSYMTGQNISIFTNDSGYLTTAVTSVGTTGLISGGPITTTGTVTTSMNTNKLVGRSTVGTGIMEEITVGAGLSLSAGTLTASGASPLTTKGDLYTYSTIDTRLPVGLDTQILLAYSTATTGLKWGTNTAATPLGYYGAFQDLTNQTAAVINTGYPMLLGVTDLTNGVTIVSGSRITIANTGIYNIQWSGQFTNPTAAEHNITIWLRKNGVDVPGSAGIVLVPKKHGSFDGHVLPAWNYLIDPVAGDYYEFVWSTENISVYMSFTPAGSPPPSTASVIVTVTQQSGIMAGTGITAINSLTGASQTLSSTDLTITSAVSTHSFVIANNAVTDAKLRQSAGLSLVGRSTNSTGNVADITATTANQALRLDPAGTALAFSTAPLSVLISNHNTTAVLSSTNYIQITGAVSAVGVASIGSRQTAFPIGATAQNMYIKTNTAQPATGSLVISLTIATTPSALSITIAAGSALGTFSNILSAVTIAAGNLLTYEIKNNATSTSATVVTISTCFY